MTRRKRTVPCYCTACKAAGRTLSTEDFITRKTARKEAA